MPDLKSNLKYLSQVDTSKSLRAIAEDWLFIAAAISLSLYFKNTWVYLLSLVVIARSQHALLVMVHEGAHFRIAKNRSLNDFVSNYLAAFPTFFCTQSYRAYHMGHHQNLNTEDDPDWMRNLGSPEWTFPKTRLQLLGLVIKTEATMWLKLTAVFLYFSGIFFKSTFTQDSSRKLLAQKIIFYAALIFAIVHFNLGHAFLLYWLIPYLFVFPLIERVRNISEHYGLSHHHEYTQARNTVSSRAEAFLFSPHQIGYHLAHHLHPTVPFYNLPELFECLNEEEEFKKNAHYNTGFFMGGKKSVLWDLLNGDQPISKIKKPATAEFKQ